MKYTLLLLTVLIIGCKQPKPPPAPTPPPTFTILSDCTNIHGSDSMGDYILVDTIKVYGMMDACNDSGCGQ